MIARKLDAFLDEFYKSLKKNELQNHKEGDSFCDNRKLMARNY